MDDDSDVIRKPLLKQKEWTLGRTDGQLARGFLGNTAMLEIRVFHGEDLYRAGYLYGQLERETVLLHLTVLFTASPWMLATELLRLGGIHIAEEEMMRKGVQEVLEEHIELLWPEKSRTG